MFFLVFLIIPSKLDPQLPLYLLVMVTLHASQSPIFLYTSHAVSIALMLSSQMGRQNND